MDKKIDVFRVIDLAISVAVMSKKENFEIEFLEDINKNITEITELLPEILACFNGYQRLIKGLAKDEDISLDEPINPRIFTGSGGNGGG